MKSREVVRRPAERAGYRHEALVYSGIEEFVPAAVAFIYEGIAKGEEQLVVVAQPKIDLIRSELGSNSAAVTFADMADVGDNPARIIAFWHAFITEHAQDPVRGIGEPVGPGRSAAELAECQVHESLLNLAFDSSSSLWLLCPYDMAGLSDDVVADAFRTHPYIACGTDRRPSTLYRPPDPETLFVGYLAPAPPEVVRLAFGHGRLDAIRNLVGRHAAEFGLDANRSAEFVVVVNELATNAIEHGGGTGVLRVWSDIDTLICEVADGGRFDTPMAGRIPPALSSHHGRGLWIANQLCDLLQIRSPVPGTIVRAHMRRIPRN